MKPAAFTYHRAYDVNDTIAQLAELGQDAKILAGGQSLVAMMNFRLARPSALVDITRIAGLDYLERDAQGLRVGALTRHRTVETAKIDGFGVLSKAARWIGHYPIRCRGTFGGSIAHGDSTAEWCVLAVLLEARIVLQGPRGRREVPATEFFQGFFMTAAQPDEMIVEVRFPKPAPHAALTEYSQRQGDFAIVAASARLDLTEDEVLTSRVVLGGVGQQPVVVDADLAGQPANEETWRAAGEVAAAQVDPPSDGHGSSAYRKKLTAALVARALAEAAA
ncbi:molybdopterin dehydrogenase [Actinosynnema sp. ALI-1.44]|uniref:FAD binding domain-containing protein n=1 Tax=Actinosynnema sp. ALI-1.44 TaxID=1933779 RepID=UPI00097C58D3|nr:xanthine dehydrogenase family protein subunit M [Actinosynnema sp. ALI-1.44]ONI72915.1 molybdopterin dehydrogenase [Actinosynnema sp. ALI-1.44]